MTHAPIKSFSYPALGDIVQFDWEGDGEIDHSMICTGFSKSGEPLLTGHSDPVLDRPFSEIKSVQAVTYLPAENYFSGTVVYLIHMTAPASHGSAAASGASAQNPAPAAPVAPAPATPAVTEVTELRYGSGYNEGKYTGAWSNGQPNGQGKLVYEDFNKDGLFYTIGFGNRSYNALYYEGNFVNGAQYGQGTVVYDGGYKAEGTYYGRWEAGKKVFEGKLWYPDGTYLDCYMIAKDGETADWFAS